MTNIDVIKTKMEATRSSTYAFREENWGAIADSDYIIKRITEIGKVYVNPKDNIKIIIIDYNGINVRGVVIQNQVDLNQLVKYRPKYVAKSCSRVVNYKVTELGNWCLEQSFTFDMDVIDTLSCTFLQECDALSNGQGEGWLYVNEDARTYRHYFMRNPFVFNKIEST